MQSDNRWPVRRHQPRHFAGGTGYELVRVELLIMTMNEHTEKTNHYKDMIALERCFSSGIV